MDDFQLELVNDFLLESSEGLETFDQDLLLIEKGECDLGLLNEVFRVVHTIKGTAGCLGFSQIESIAHTGENVLSLMRDGELESTPHIADALLKLSDALREMLGVIEDSGSDESACDCSDLKSVLDSIIKGEPATVKATPPPEPEIETPVAEEAPESADEGWGLFGEESTEEVEAPEPVAEAPQAWGLFEGDEPKTEGPAESEAVDSKSPEGDPAGAWGIYADESEASIAETDKPEAKKPARPVPTPQKPKGDSISSASVRVDVELLDNLMNMVGELVLSRNQLLQLSHQRDIEPAQVSGIAQRFNQVTTDLQQGIMKTRMQQIGTVWGKYPRIVRDLAADLGKQVNLQTFGADTELDRTIIEAIKDPLTHIIRNAVDHGIEKPDVRSAAGKSPDAELLMRAFHEGGQVNIEIIDDGAGIDGNKICGKALEKGLIDVDEAGRLSEREKINLIFLPGFSTAEKLSNVSGRGVGMDVVKTNIEKIGGSVDIQSVKGEGTTLRIRIPLTLAIVAALVVKSGNQRFAIPQVNIVELVRIKSDDLASIERVYDSPVYRLRGKLLPLVFLDEFLQLDKLKDDERSSVSIVVLRSDGQDFGLVVDVVSDTEEIVVKPLGNQLSDMQIYAGATIMGDGSVAIILDAAGMSAKAAVLKNGQKSIQEQNTEFEENSQEFGRKEPLILFSLPGWDHLAVPLESAERLEEFEPKIIQTSGGVETVPYRGGIMQLLRLGNLLGVGPGNSDVQFEQVIVYKCGDRYLGLVVGENKDIVEQVLRLEDVGSRPYIRGSFIIDGQITDLVDVESILSRAGLKGKN